MANLLRQLSIRHIKISKKHSDGPVEVEGQSLMRNYNDVMTVAGLTDIVVFL